MKLAIIGSGISGLTAAYLLHREHDITVFEAADRLGGHTATIDVEWRGQEYQIDTGFIVFNDWTYPNFQKILKQINVPYRPTSMGFSVSCEKTGLEYSGNNLNGLFAQRRNLIRLQHWRMISDILRFNKESLADIESGGHYLSMSLGEYLHEKRYSDAFIHYYLIPMGAAIWSATTQSIQAFSLQFFVQFFKNHGLLSIKNRPQWYVVEGGSSNYIEPLISSYKKNIRLNSEVLAIDRTENFVAIKTANGSVEHFDQVVIASHSDQALAMLNDASDDEMRLLSLIPYQNNEVVLHTDISLLPSHRNVWSSWNYRVAAESDKSSRFPPVLTYNMNILQSIESEETFCVTLNKTEAIDPQKIIGVYQYSHPVFSLAAQEAQHGWHTINGVNRTWFCGAYWRNGFHEDGVVSAIRVAESLGVRW